MGLFLLGVFAVEKGKELFRDTPLAPDSRGMEEILQDDDLEALEKRLSNGADPNAKDVFDQALITWVRSPKALEIMLRHGADPQGRDKDGDTPLMEAARAGDVESVRVLLAAGADVNAVNPEYGSEHTAMIDAISGGDGEVLRLFKAAGAVDTRVTAENGQPLPADGGEPFRVCVEYIAAIHRQDPDAMYPLTVWPEPIDSSGTDWNTLQSVRPVAPRFLGGFFNETYATLTLSGETPAGFEAEWRYQLRRLRAEQEPLLPEGKTRIEPHTTGLWRIVREDWLVD